MHRVLLFLCLFHQLLVVSPEKIAWSSISTEVPLLLLLSYRLLVRCDSQYNVLKNLI